MIVVDSSALMAIILREPEADMCLAALARHDEILISAVTWTEVHIVAEGKQVSRQLSALLSQIAYSIISTDQSDAQAAIDAYRRWGKGRHRAKLNLGDTFSYALARSRNCPLLYVGNDFAQTDIASAVG